MNMLPVKTLANLLMRMQPLKAENSLPTKINKNSLPTELICSDGVFNEANFKDFLNTVELHKYGSSYAVVAVMGPQSSGKSTLMNHLFSTNFIEMNAESGRGQTTKGIWIAKALHTEPFTIVLDLEGTDGRERGQDDTTFEKQSALFALAVADIVIINMWCIDIGRENAANRPLLKTIFEGMVRLFSPHKTTLLFAIRDKTTTPYERLQSILREDIQKIWKTVLKPKGREDTLLSEFFNVEVTALSHYRYEQHMFLEEVAKLRLQYFHSISPGRLVGKRHELPFRSAKNLWDIIKDHKDFDLPPHKVMVATVRCEEIAIEKLELFESNQEWLALQEAAEKGLILGFNAKIIKFLNRYLSQYDEDSDCFEKGVRNVKRQYLESEALKLVHPAYMNTLGHLRSEALGRFGTQVEALLREGGGFAESVRTCKQSCVLHFDQQCSVHAAVKQANWDASTVRTELVRDIENHALLVRTEKLPQIIDQQRERLSTMISRQLKHILNDRGDNDIWDSIRGLVKSESATAASALSSAVVKFELDRAKVEEMVDELKQYARKLVETNFKEETRDATLLLKHRFIGAFYELTEAAEKGNITTKEKANYLQIKGMAYYKCLKLLSTMAVIRLDERYDNVEASLHVALMGPYSGIEIPADPLASKTWEEVPPEMTRICPVQCRDIWTKFKLDMELNLAKTKYVEEKCEKENEKGKNKKTKKNPTIPTWAILGLGVLAFAGFTVFLRVTNIDVVLGLTLAGAAATGIAIEALCNNKKKSILENLKQVLKRFYDFMIDILAITSAIEVGA